jgi:uncharacterized protein (DUF433 family)
MDWLSCEWVEVVPGRLNGVPVIRGTRVTPETVVLNRELGVDEIAAQFRLPVSAVEGVLSFWDERRARVALAS